MLTGIFLEWAGTAALHDKPKTGKYSFPIATVEKCLSLLLLWAGGFFK
jgi:hypothetical protein